jgi:hypothetical protein
VKTFTRDGVTIHIMAHFHGYPGQWTSGEAAIDKFVCVDIEPSERVAEGLTLFSDVTNKLVGKTLKDWRELVEGEI